MDESKINGILKERGLAIWWALQLSRNLSQPLVDNFFSGHFNERFNESGFGHFIRKKSAS